MNERRFKFTLPDRIVRGMNRQQYKTASRWLRLSCRIVHDSINWEAFERHIRDVLIYGADKISYEDLLK